MFFKKKSHWLWSGNKLINLDNVAYFETNHEDDTVMDVYFSGYESPRKLHLSKIGDIYHLLKYGKKPRKR